MNCDPKPGINPASIFCQDQGGKVEIRDDASGGQVGICIFADGSECEEWALFRGDCPVGGIKITGYITPAAVYCAITAGNYAVTGQSNTQQEQGTCTFKNGKVCDVWDLWNEKCSSNQ